MKTCHQPFRPDPGPDAATNESRRRFLGQLLGTAVLGYLGEIGVAQGGQVPPDQLLAALNLDYPGLEAVRAACDRNDLAAARTALAAYYRSRTRPVWHFNPASPPKNLSGGARRAADDALRHTFNVCYVPWTFTGPINWIFNPTALPGSKNALTYEWPEQFNRHPWWRDLAQAYVATRNARYADELVAELLDWIAKNPKPANAKNQNGLSWRTLEAGIRALTWTDVFFLMLRQREVFPDAALLAMVESLRQHADYLDAFHSTAGNWLFTELTGLLTIGAVFPEFSAAPAWRKNAFDLMEQRLKSDVYPDGVEAELTPGYHVVCMDDLITFLSIAWLEGYTPPPSLLVQLEKMHDAMMWASAPDRFPPPLNDSWFVPIKSLLARGLDFVPGREDWKYFATDGKQGKAPAKTSCLLPWSGWAVMRGGWGDQALFSLMDCGPFGLAHQHEDKLSFVLHAYGREFVHDAGTHMYDVSEMRKYVVSARGHNVIHVDGLEQHRGDQNALKAGYVRTQPAVVVWQTDGAYDYASASFGKEPGESWGPKHLRGTVHTRRILFVKPGYWIVVDSLIPADAKEHVYDSTFHLNVAGAAVHPATKAVATQNPDGANLNILPLVTPDLNVRIITGQMQPFVQGWLPETKTMRDAGARPCAYFTRQGTGPVHFLYVFSPCPAGGASPVVSVARNPAVSAPLAAVLTLANGQKQHVLLAPTGELIVDGIAGKILRLAAG